MKQRRTGGVLAVAMSVALVASASVGSAAASAAEEKTETVKKIRVKKKMECEGEDCPDTRHVVIKKIGPGGETQEMGSEGKGCPCMAGGAERHMIVVGNGGEMHEIHTLEDADIEWHDGDCEGEDCAGARRIVIKTIGSEGDPHLLHAMAMHHPGAMAHGKGGFLGVQLTDLTPELRRHFGVGEDVGVIIGKVVEESAAQAAGLAVGDIVVSADGKAVMSGADLARIIGSHGPGDAVEIEVWSAGARSAKTVVLGESSSAAQVERHMRRVIVTCDEDDEECEVDLAGTGMEIDCGDAEECDVEMVCDSGECTCTMNGVETACEELGMPHHSGG